MSHISHNLGTINRSVPHLCSCFCSPQCQVDPSCPMYCSDSNVLSPRDVDFKGTPTNLAIKQISLLSRSWPTLKILGSCWLHKVKIHISVSYCSEATRMLSWSFMLENSSRLTIYSSPRVHDYNPRFVDLGYIMLLSPISTNSSSQIPLDQSVSYPELVYHTYVAQDPPSHKSLSFVFLPLK